MAVKKFENMSKEQQKAELKKIRDMIDYGLYQHEKNTAKNASEAYDKIELIFTKSPRVELLCFYFCPECPKEECVVFADTSNGTGILVRDKRRHEKEAKAMKEEEGEVENESQVSNLQASSDPQQPHSQEKQEQCKIDATADDENDSLLPNLKASSDPRRDSSQQPPVPQKQKQYTIDATDLAKAFSEISKIGHSSGPLTEALFRDLMPDDW